MMVRRLMALAVFTLGSAFAEPPDQDLVEVYAQGRGPVYEWVVTVSKAGQVRVERTPFDAHPTIHRLNEDELRRLKASVVKQRHWELPPQVGYASTEVPSRIVNVWLPEGRASFVLYNVPKSVSVSRMEAGFLERGLNVCELVRSLAKDERLTPCTK